MDIRKIENTVISFANSLLESRAFHGHTPKSRANIIAAVGDALDCVHPDLLDAAARPALMRLAVAEICRRNDVK